MFYNNGNFPAQYGNRSKFGYRKRYYKRQFGLPRSYVPMKMTRNEVSKIAKKVVKKSQEVKRFDYRIDQALTQGAWYVTYLMNGLTQNVSSQGVIGRRIDLQGFRFRIRWANSSGTHGASGAVYRFLVFKTAQQLTTSTSAAVAQGNIFRTNPSTFDITAMTDPDQVDVIVDKSGVINPNTDGNTEGDVDLTILDIPYKRKLDFLVEGGGFCKEDNYYMYFGMARDDGLITTAGYCQIGVEVMYTDS